MELEKLIDEVSVRMRLRKVEQDSEASGRYSEREILLLELIDANKKISISDITAKFQIVGKSIISSTISNFWKAQLVNKDKDFINQRTTYVSLTSEGKKLLNTIRKHRAERFSDLVEALNLNSKQKEMLEQILENAIKSLKKK